MSCSPATTTPPTRRWWPSWGARSQRIHTNVQVGTQILFIEAHNELCISFAVLVTDKVRRTAKFMCMVAKGIPIVGPGWLSQSKETKTFQGMIHTMVELSSFFILEIFFHPQILGYTLSRTKSPRRSGVSVSAGLSERLQRRLCSQITKFTRPSRWFLPLNSLKVQNSYQHVMMLSVSQFSCISRNCRMRWRPIPQVAAQEYSVGRSQDLRDRIGLGQGVAGGGQEEEFARRRQGDSPHWPTPPRARF